MAVGAEGSVTTDVLAAADVLVTLGSEARIDPDLAAAAPAAVHETWQTDELSTRGIEVVDRIRLVRDDIATRVADLHHRLS